MGEATKRRLRQVAILAGFALSTALAVAALVTGVDTPKATMQAFLLMCAACVAVLLPIEALAEHGWKGYR